MNPSKLADAQRNPFIHSSLFSRVHATLQVTLSVCRSVGLSVGRSVGWSVGRSHFAFFAFLGYLQVGKHIFEYLVS